MRRIFGIFLGLTLILLFFVAVTPVTYAQTVSYKACGQNQMWSPDLQMCLPTDAPGFATAIYQVGLMLISFVAVIFLMIGGYNIMMSRGNVEQLERGKSYVFYSIAGILLAIFGFVFIEIVTGDILNLPGFGK